MHLVENFPSYNGRPFSRLYFINNEYIQYYLEKNLNEIIQLILLEFASNFFFRYKANL